MNDKKKPGRPRRFPCKLSSTRAGIQQQPIREENHIELSYDSPLILRRLFALFKSMAVKELRMDFEKNDIHITTVDHFKKTYIRTVIHGSKVNHYYCKEDTTIFITPKNIENVMRILDKSYTSVDFILPAGNTRNVLIIIFKNVIGIDEVREIQLNKSSQFVETISYSTDNYPIKFTLPGSYFKKIIKDINSLTDIFTINKIGNASMTITYQSKDRTILSKHIVNATPELKMTSLIADDDIFAASINVDYIQPLGNALLSDNISIAADTKKNMIFILSVDNDTMSIFISAEIVR
jgi:hypothetical protein